ncbi:GFA family protein [Pseudomonas sp. NPDC090202]|uniref:GFA family protein n=1 Tax=unclassified Pseudomonas TaxID=196821 RepID=UPI0037FF6E9D
MNREQTDFEGACHCGTVRFRVKLSGGLNSARRCNCSYCRMRGAVAVTATQDNFHLVAGEDALTLYEFNTHTAKHYFCSLCGIYIHHRRRSNPDQLGVNAACLDGVSPFDFAEVPVNDGVNHPSDRTDKNANGILGVLRFVPADQG